jgi:hypothetical protein
VPLPIPKEKAPVSHQSNIPLKEQFDLLKSQVGQLTQQLEDLKGNHHSISTVLKEIIGTKSDLIS